MTAHTKPSVLDRAHTLLVVLLGSAAAVLVMSLPDKPQTVAAQFVWLAVGLAVGFGISYVADVALTTLARRETRAAQKARQEKAQRDAAEAQRMDDAIRASEERSARFWADYEATHGPGSVDRT